MNPILHIDMALLILGGFLTGGASAAGPATLIWLVEDKRPVGLAASLFGLAFVAGVLSLVGAALAFTPA